MAKAEFFKDMDIDTYHSKSDIISKSMLSEFADCPARFKHLYIDGNKKPKTKSLRLGNAVHVMALEPELWKSNYHITPDHYFNDKGKKSPWRHDLRMQVVRDEYESAGYDVEKGESGKYDIKERENSKVILTRAESDKVEAMAESLTKNQYAISLLKSAGYIESSIFFDKEVENEDTGEIEIVRCRARPDLMRNDGLIVDIKTARSVHPETFFKDAYNLHYDLSAALTFDAYEALHEKPADNYVFVAVEPEGPHLVECFHSLEADDLSGFSYLEYGQAHLEKLMKRYVACRASGNWPSYQEKIGGMAIPSWAMRKFIEKGI